MTLHTPNTGYILPSILLDHPPCRVVEVDGECDEGAVAVHLRLHRGLHPAHGHGGGDRSFGRRQEDGVGLCRFKDLSDDRFSINSAILWPLSNFLNFYGYKITFSWTLHYPNHGERLFEKPQHLLNYRQNKETLRTATGTINSKMPICCKTRHRAPK